MRKERNPFPITNHYIYAFSRPSWSIAHGHGVCTQSVPAPTLSLDLHAHTHTGIACCCLGRGVDGCMYSNIFFLFHLNNREGAKCSGGKKAGLLTATGKSR